MENLREIWATLDFPTLLVFPKSMFPEVCDELRGVEGIAYISIEATPECAKYWLEEEKEDDDNEHYLKDADNVLNLNFDDLTKDVEYKPGLWFKTISMDQAKETVEFIKRHLGKKFIIHCKAGQSRSQGVARFIFDCFPELYKRNSWNYENPDTRPNMEVVRKLKRAFLGIEEED